MSPEPAAGTVHTPSGAGATRTARRVAQLERSSTRIVDQARDAGVTVTYLGIAPLFREPRAYAGPATDWIISPAADASDAVVPRRERTALLKLVDAGIDFPLLYVAHEIPKGRVALPASGDEGQSRQVVALDRAAAVTAVGPVPPPAAATELADRLGRSSHQILSVLAKAVPIAGAIVAAPFVLAGAALGALAMGLDPIVFGVIPASRAVPGQPASWYILAQWEWSSVAPGIGPDRSS